MLRALILLVGPVQETGAATVDHRELWTYEETVAAGHSMDPGRWREAFEVVMGRIAGRFARVEPRLRAGRLVLGLLSDLPRKNCWTIAEWAGTPHGMQHLLCRASWDADAVRDDVREYVVEDLHDEAAVLVVDETGDVKKGTHTVGVQRQYTGTPDGSRTPRSRSVSSMRAAAGTRRWTGSCTSRAPGLPTPSDARRPGSARTFDIPLQCAEPRGLPSSVQNDDVKLIAYLGRGSSLVPPGRMFYLVDKATHSARFDLCPYRGHRSHCDIKFLVIIKCHFAPSVDVYQLRLCVSSLNLSSVSASVYDGRSARTGSRRPWQPRPSWPAPLDAGQQE
ncbi:hypothetical protein GCM10010271_26200 [Streptomyces kurssanovii]|nr:hypothetical protein GCM10010271_26200 [Streptomyces kurssanovii]